jgi:transposase
MANKYEPELRDKVLRLHLEEGRSKKSLTEEYNLGQGTISYWLKQYRKECETNNELKSTDESYAETRRLRAEIAELKKENDFLKKAAAFFAKEID